MEYITPFLYLLNTMAPYLLLGFLLAGVIHAYVPRRLYARYLSQPDRWHWPPSSACRCPCVRAA